MTEPTGPVPQPNHKADAAEPTKAKGPHYSDKAVAPFKKMMPDATRDQLDQMFDNFAKAINAEIQQLQKYHEENWDRDFPQNDDDS